MTPGSNDAASPWCIVKTLMYDSSWKIWRQRDLEISVRPPGVVFLGFGLFAAHGGADFSFSDFLESEPARAALRRHMGPRVLLEAVAAVTNGMPRLWNNGAFSVEVRAPEVCIGTNDARGGTGTSWPASGFLSGVHDRVVRDNFGQEVLDEIRARLVAYGTFGQRESKRARKKNPRRPF